MHVCIRLLCADPWQENKALNVLIELKGVQQIAHVILEPLDFMARLAALVPRPRLNLTRFHGVFAPNFKHRQRIVPRRGQGRVDADKPRAPMTWVQRLKRVFAIDIETCPHCGGTLRVIACIEEPALIARILGHVQQREELNGPLTRAPPGQQEVRFNLN